MEKIISLITSFIGNLKKLYENLSTKKAIESMKKTFIDEFNKIENKINRIENKIDKIENNDLKHIEFNQLKDSLYNDIAHKQRDKQAISEKYQKYDTLRIKLNEGEEPNLKNLVNNYKK